MEINIYLNSFYHMDINKFPNFQLKNTYILYNYNYLFYIFIKFKYTLNTIIFR